MLMPCHAMPCHVMPCMLCHVMVHVFDVSHAMVTHMIHVRTRSHKRARVPFWFVFHVTCHMPLSVRAPEKIGLVIAMQLVEET